ncbi:MAG: hypothetical protein CL452_04585 [Acidimicrobiaceae bacterium]|nr:hypothetical protein [Acidimicrobiaceae bacterium]
MDSEDGCLVSQRAHFVPKGVIGRLYWFALLLPHSLIFNRMLSKIIATAELDRVQ